MSNYFYHLTEERVTFGPFDTIALCSLDAASNPANVGKKITITCEVKVRPILAVAGANYQYEQATG